MSQSSSTKLSASSLSKATSSTPPPPPRKSRAVACAECRRLKLKCDRAFPCLNCRRREVANLCPNDALITRSRTSYTTTNEAINAKQDPSWMLRRIKALEEALALVQSKVSTEPHPLLLDFSDPSGTPEEQQGSVSSPQASTSDTKTHD